MFEESNKDHVRITEAAVAALQAKYPRLRIEEHGSIQEAGWYDIEVLFPSLPRERILVFNGDSAETIVAYVTEKIQELVQAATQQAAAIVADVGPVTSTYVRVTPPTPEEFVRAWQQADYIEDVAERLHQSAHTLWIRAIRYRKKHGVPLKHLQSRNHGTDGSGFREAVNWDALARIARESLKS